MKKIDKNKIKTWFITGASSGFGAEISRQLLERGYNVIAVARRIPQIDHPNALCLSVDVTKPETIKEAINKGLERFGSIEVVMNNAGLSRKVTLEEETLESLQNVINTNLYGTFNIINAILPYFRKQKNGTIIANSSMNGLSLRAYGTAYCSSKYAVEGLTSVCWHETKSFCRVMLVEPGFFPQTAIASKIDLNNLTQIDEYKNLKDYPQKIRNHRINDVALAVKYIIETVEQEELPRRLILGEDAINKIRAEIKYLNKDLKNSAKKKFLKKNKLKKLLNKLFGRKNNV